MSIGQEFEGEIHGRGHAFFIPMCTNRLPEVKVRFVRMGCAQISLIQNTVDHLPQRSQQIRGEHTCHFQASAYVENGILKN